MREPYGAMPDGAQIDIFTLRNANGVEIHAITYGGIITSLEVPDRTGQLGDIVLGFDTLAGYLEAHPFFGAIVGRYGNRIGKGDVHARRHDRTRWRRTTARTTCTAASRASTRVSGRRRPCRAATPSRSRRTSADGEEGYPGNLECASPTTLTDKNELIVDYPRRPTRRRRST